MDETWIQRSRDQRTVQTMEIMVSCVQRSSAQLKSSNKVLASVFWDTDGILLVDYLKQGATITAKCCVVLLDKLKQKLVSRHWKGIVFLQDNSYPHKAIKMHQQVADLHFKVLKHPAYSPDLAPLDYCLFHSLKKHFEGRRFSSIEKATLAVNTWFTAQPS
jgi:hypothetical protein